MRHKPRLDSNQKAIVDALRSIPDCVVYSTAAIGHGFPDLCVGYQGINYLFEIKDGSLIPSRRKLTKDEESFFAKWTGQAAVVESVEDALTVIGVQT